MSKKCSKKKIPKGVKQKVISRRRKNTIKQVTSVNHDVYELLGGEVRVDNSVDEITEDDFKECYANDEVNRSVETQNSSIQEVGSNGNMNKLVASREMKLQLFDAIVGYLTSFPAKDFFNEVIRNEIEESAKNNEIMFTALLKAIEESSKHSKGKSASPEEFKKPVTYFDFTMCEDEQFQEMVHVTRKTAKTIIEHIKGIPVDLDCNSETFVCGLTHRNEPIDKILFLVLWYLSSKDNNLEDAVGMFELGTVENARKLLNRGLTLLLKLKADAGLLWPTSEEFLIDSTHIERRFYFPNAAAVMGHHIINCENGQRLMLQGVCNGKGMFIDVFTSFDMRPRIVFKQSMLKKKFQELAKNGLCIVSEDFSVSEKSKKNIMFPYKKESVEISTEQQLFNVMHEFVIIIIKEAFNQLLSRFPRLNLLDECEPEIVTVACVLHNYCIKLNDLTPL